MSGLKSGLIASANNLAYISVRCVIWRERERGDKDIIQVCFFQNLLALRDGMNSIVSFAYTSCLKKCGLFLIVHNSKICSWNQFKLSTMSICIRKCNKIGGGGGLWSQFLEKSIVYGIFQKLACFLKWPLLKKIDAGISSNFLHSIRTSS